VTLVAILTHVASALWKGVLLGLQYNPVFGIIGAVVAAAVLGSGQVQPSSLHGSSATVS
jgi:uncharacterized membrane protein YeaQ/YmgE (transglycosylase-associated protein family)